MSTQYYTDYKKKEPLKIFWDGFYSNGSQRFFIECSDGTIINDKDERYNPYFTRLKTKEYMDKKQQIKQNKIQSKHPNNFV